MFSTRALRLCCPTAILLCIVIIIVTINLQQGSVDAEKLHLRVRRGNYGQRYSGGLGSQGAYNGGGYHPTNQRPQLIFDHIALNAVSGGNNNFIQQYQATVNSQASQAGAYDSAQQGGQHAAAHAGLAANQVGQWYNAIATGPVAPGYKGEYRKRR